MREVVADKQAKLAFVKRQNLTWMEDNPVEQEDVDWAIKLVQNYGTAKSWETLKDELFRCGGDGLTGEAKPTEAIK